MKLSAARDVLLKPLQAVIGVVERRQTMPILSNVLLVARDGTLSVTATDLEVELVAQTELDVQTGGEITVSGRKLLDICRALPEDAKVEINASAEKLNVRSGRSKFSLATLPAAEFPTVEDIKADQTIPLPQEVLVRLIEKTHFSMAQQDVRYYLNGMLLETGGKYVRTVATDGHRLVRFVNTQFSGSDYIGDNIIPGKFLGILGTYLEDDDEVKLNIGENHIMIQSQATVLFTRIIEERFPDYESVFPKENTKNLKIDRDEVLAAVRRVSIFSNKTTHQISFQLNGDGLKVSTEDVETVSKAQETVPCEYSGEPLTIGYNANYLRDILSHLDSSTVLVELESPVTAAIFYPDQQEENEELTMLLMPIRLNE